MPNSCEVTDIFYLCDEFSSDFQVYYSKHALREDNSKKYRNKSKCLSDSEVMTILISFHLSGMRNLKVYYLFYVYTHMNSEFPQLVSYNRFVGLQQRLLLV
ncbi:hypothetical protein [Dysgonomonas sp. Marseille-P4677]|uniref:hypothetical protein n=1 Tax=Dysgonomonas sp. Marseille-P4677 TaxID=2364790 RepID=UPI001F3FF9AA|nr:hypothetical protein [Dysgonomonas sp. Marseille-P4677]